MKQAEIRQALIDGTIHVIAQEGLDGATTKMISTTTGINQVYIYRLFKDKEDLYTKSFEYLDKELVSKFLYHLPIMSMNNLSIEERARMLFMVIWRFLLGNRDECLSYVRYYYSTYFNKYSIESHKEDFKKAVEEFSVVFKEEANVWMLLNHIFNVMLDFATKVFDGQLRDNDDTAEHVFRLVFVSVNQYFKDGIRQQIAM